MLQNSRLVQLKCLHNSFLAFPARVCCENQFPLVLGYRSFISISQPTNQKGKGIAKCILLSNWPRHLYFLFVWLVVWLVVLLLLWANELFLISSCYYCRNMSHLLTNTNKACTAVQLCRHTFNRAHQEDILDVSVKHAVQFILIQNNPPYKTQFSKWHSTYSFCNWLTFCNKYINKKA